MNISALAPLQLNLSWDAPYAPAGVELTFIVYAENVNTGSVSISEDLNTTYYMFDGTTPCEEYLFTVVASNTAGSSDRSESVNGSLPACMYVRTLRQCYAGFMKYSSLYTVPLINIMEGLTHEVDLMDEVSINIMFPVSSNIL